MIWLTWRQFRSQAAVVMVAVVALTLILAATGPQLADLYDTAGSDLMRRLTGADQATYYAAGAAVLLVPPLAGMFWGAPLVARELEAGTHRLAWNQSITRARWLTAKLALPGLVAVAAAGLTSLAVSWWSGPIDRAIGAGGSDNTDNFVPRIDPLVFGARGIAPLGYAAFAFLLGVALGLLIRRTVPAMATTLVLYTVVQVAMVLWVRPRLAAPLRIDAPFTADTMANYGIDSVSQVDIGEPGSWVVSEQTVDASGHAAAHMPPAYAVCDSAKACIDALADAGYHQRVSYQPAGNFWALQWAETGIHLALAAGLAALCAWWIRRRTV
ncbi:ABC transporter permease [Streptomyces sp. RKAG290]|uniref:ABC transporter permease n=1 Tax=Streptomyces sp. RKAG290 TaxID=2888348 RepID=UPI002034806E|nr:ABC transporter permease [Streptomyces sp. RKAG290]MCM2413193.1 ABC transporter permease [Streptomyces sp. RKAG290]